MHCTKCAANLICGKLALARTKKRAFSASQPFPFVQGLLTSLHARLEHGIDSPVSETRRTPFAKSLPKNMYVSPKMSAVALFFVLLVASQVPPGKACECYSTGLMCGWAIACSPDHHIFQCNRVGDQPTADLGPCNRGCVRAAPNHYCVTDARPALP